jgi:hypothetical protein
MKNVVLAFLSAVFAQALVIGVELCADITIEFVPRVLISIPLTLLIEFPMLAVFGRK